eukprot:TRINITY_DN7822_c0_g1_i3.p1 TRINITY_DN7822_c0_g1~~TRINITY_DN7822_c0_g1_i3.p1  ORF type:complete len:762 (-),score=202.44 TRINITY_DN7822_c0_g1_i3:192-2477(-)
MTTIHLRPNSVSLRNFFDRPSCKNRAHRTNFAPPVREDGEYDFIVVGGGTAGNIVAARLADESPNVKVLLLEAGRNMIDDYREVSRSLSEILKMSYCVPGQTADSCSLLSLPLHFSESPFMVPYMSSTNHSYYYQITPQIYGNKREINYPRGKLLGGSSATNNLVAFRGHPEDYDHWASLGLEGWSYQDLLPFMKRIETNHDYAGHEAHGDSGPIHLKNSSDFFNFPVVDELLKASWRLGYPKVEDFNKGYDYYGAGYWQQYSNDKGRRTSTYEYIRRLMHGERVCIDGFIAENDQDEQDHLKAPANPNEKNEGKRRPCTDKQNLRIITAAQTTKLIIERKEGSKPRAIGVEFVNATSHPYLANRKYAHNEKYHSEEEKSRAGMEYWKNEQRHDVMNCPVNQDLAFSNERKNEWYIPSYDKPLPQPEIKRVYAKREVILSAGAINTPQLLMLSGVGPRKHLEHQLGFKSEEVVMDLPGIGRLLDHEEITVQFKLPSSAQHWGPLKDMLTETGKWVKGAPSAFGSNHVPAGLDTSSEGINGTKPTIHIHFVMLYFENLDLNAWMEQDAKHRVPVGMTDFGFWEGLQHYTMLIERSGDCNEGRLHLRNRDPLVPPFLDMGYGSCQFTIKELIFGIRESRRLNSLLPDHLRGVEVHPGEKYQTDEELANFIRSTSWGHHISGSVPLGPCDDINAAADSHGRIFGVEGLRVADASAFPSIPHGNIMYSTMIVGERIVDLILKDNNIENLGETLLQRKLGGNVPSS